MLEVQGTSHLRPLAGRVALGHPRSCIYLGLGVKPGEQLLMPPHCWRRGDGSRMSWGMPAVSIEHILREVYAGHVLRHAHANGASLFFIAV